MTIQKAESERKEGMMIDAAQSSLDGYKLGATTARKEMVEKVTKLLKPYIEYCEEQNGRSYCKNCGLDLDDFLAALTEI